MKFLYILRHYQKGIRLSSLMITLLLIWAMLAGVLAYAKIQNVTAGLEILKSAPSNHTYVSMHFTTADEFMSGSDQDEAKALEQMLEKEEMVDTVFSVRTINPVAYKGEKITVTLYEPQMLNYFPKLKQIGIDFSQAPNGVILGSTLFSGIEAGDEITLNFSMQASSPKARTFPVAGNLRAPYQKFSLATSSTAPVAADFFVAGDTVIMQATDQIMEQLDGAARRVEHNCNLIVVFKEGYEEDACRALLKKLAPKNSEISLASVIRNTEEAVSYSLREQLPQPLFLAVSSLFAYLSVLILNYKKKEKELSVLYLLGYSRRRCATLSLVQFMCYALPAMAVSSAVILFWPTLEWQLDALVQRSVGSQLYPKLMALNTLVGGYTIGVPCLTVVAAYLVITVGVAFGVAVGTMMRYSPVAYRKGASL